MKPPSTLLALLLVVGTVLPSGVSGQLTGVVTDTADAPLEGVVVEAWSADSLVASRITATDGRFAFPGSVAERTLRLRAGRLGYRIQVEEVGREGGEHHLRLVEEPIVLRGLTVESERSRCGEEEQPAARRLWQEVRRRYSGSLDTVGIATYLAEAEAWVARDEIGPLDLPDRMLAQRGSSSQLRFSWTRRARRSGYAFRVRRTDSGRSFDSWAYAPLEAAFAPHFVDPVFGELHHFNIRERGAFGWILAFCPREPDRPSIRGTMRIGADSSVISVEWLFETPEPDESAGGRAHFPPSEAESAAAHLLPRESMVWRRLPDGRFHEVHQRYDEWIVAQGDTVPFLPPRTSGRR